MYIIMINVNERELMIRERLKFSGLSCQIYC